MSAPTKVLVTVDIVVFTIIEQRLHVLLIRRLAEPFRGSFALPGGFVLEKESLDDAAARELREETGVGDVYLEQLYSFGALGRDPRGRVVTVAYYALIPSTKSLQAGSDAEAAKWFDVETLPELAFDHKGILTYAHERLRNKLDYTNVGFELLPAKFTLSELQAVHEAILGEPLDKRNFRRKMAQQGLLKPLKEMRATGRKPAQLFQFKRR